MKTVFIIILTILVAHSTTAQYLDSSFGKNGIVIAAPFGPNDNIATYAIAPTNDGKILAPAWNLFAVTQFKRNGSIDSSFGNYGTAQIITSTGSEVATATIVQPDGKIIIAGYADMGSDDIAIARFNADGTIDNSFGTNGAVTYDVDYDDKCWGVTLQPDGKIVLCGEADRGRLSLVMRLNIDGSLDTTFNKTGIFTIGYSMYLNVLRSVIVKPDGKILSGGYTNPGGSFTFFLLQLKADGTLDSSFGTNGAVLTNGVGGGKDIVLQADGKIVMVGRDAFSDGYVVRYHADGRVDSSFAVNGIINITHPNGMLGLDAVAIDGAGKIYTCGFVCDGSMSSDEDMFLIRLDSSGKKDPSFGGNNGIVTKLGSKTDRAYDMFIQQDGRIVTGGATRVNGSTNYYAMIRYLPFPVAIQDALLAKSYISTYPNPSMDRLYIQTADGTGLPANAHYVIRDVTGKEQQAGGLNKSIDISRLTTGMYILIVEYSNKLYSTPFIKH